MMESPTRDRRKLNIRPPFAVSARKRAALLRVLPPSREHPMKEKKMKTIQGKRTT
jgi:hypothetical protein